MVIGIDLDKLEINPSLQHYNVLSSIEIEEGFGHIGETNTTLPIQRKLSRGRQILMVRVNHLLLPASHW